ncbi:ANTAR domain-containing response regulator [Pararhodobacter aggregans]|uniref:Two-component system response regulator n=1 Tax=Pararhodobacter aggregans TaxID=404875 RepID=A0A2T7UM38_9RHOB|nr:ANTAR domain-containing protein [Pararhodobacter aggregans]PTX00009.1 response regulator receiver and ANTAR domain protein [Pararhodobacter aggregans]PVE45763.1 two-component system response regulator [Pararhodobacter aggregans]
MTRGIDILVVESDPTRARAVADALSADGGCRVVILADVSSLARRIAEMNPDVVLIDMENPSRDVIEDLSLAAGPKDRAVALFAPGGDTALMRAAIEAGVSAYVAEGVRPEVLRPVIDLAIAQFGQMQRLRTELEATRRALEERKLIDRAKGILMRARGLSEDEAYALLRKTAMDQKKRLAEVAAALVTAAGLLG